MVEGTGLENRRTRKGIVSSNLTLSACGSSERSLRALDWRSALPARVVILEGAERPKDLHLSWLNEYW